LFRETNMLKTLWATVRQGKIELVDSGELPEGIRVLVTLLPDDEIDLKSQGVDREQAEALRTGLATFSEDWNSPEMSIYDNYDSAKDNY
jgi:hypothetical protein